MTPGRSCQVHQKDFTSKQAASDLMTTSSLLDSALGYSPESDLQVSIINMRSESTVLIQKLIIDRVSADTVNPQKCAYPLF